MASPSSSPQFRVQPPPQLAQLWEAAPAGTRLLAASTFLLSLLGLFLGSVFQPVFVLSPGGVFYLGRGWTIVSSYLYRPIGAPIRPRPTSASPTVGGAARFTPFGRPVVPLV